MPSIKARIREIDAEFNELIRQGYPEREWDDASLGRLFAALDEPDEEGEVPLYGSSDPTFLDLCLKLSDAHDQVAAANRGMANLKAWIYVLALCAAGLGAAVLVAIGENL